MISPLLAALAAAILTQTVTILLFRAGRRNDRRKAALIDVQEAVLTLREATQRYGLAVREAGRAARVVNGHLDLSVPADVYVAWNSARARLQVMLSRIDDTEVVATIATWRDRLDANSVSWIDVSSAVEQQALDDVVRALGRAARSDTGRGDRTTWLRRQR